MTLLADLRFAVRSMRRSPLFTLVALIVLAVGTSGMTTSFGIVDAFLLEPLPYRDAERLVHLYRTDPQTRQSGLRFSLPMIDRLGPVDGIIEEIAAYSYRGRNISGGEADPEHVTAALLTENLMHVLGVRPALGRLFAAGDGGKSLALLDWGLWQRRYGGSPTVLGTTVYLDGNPHEVIGVMPAGFDFPYGEVKIWTPVSFGSSAYGWDWQNFQPIARLAPAAGRQQAREVLETRLRRVAESRTGVATDQGVRVVGLREALLFLYDVIRLVLFATLTANGFVLLIICANLANLLMSRAIGRTRETAMRTVLGASRRRLVGQLLTEGSVLALGGAALGLVLAAWQVRWADRMFPEALFRAEPLGVDSRVLAFALGVAVVTTLLFALLPALETTRIELVAALREGSAQTGGGRRAGRARRALVVLQVMAASALLLGTGLMVRTLLSMQSEDLGFRTRNLLTAGMHLPEAEYPDAGSIRRFHQQALVRLRELPQVEQAALADPLPMNFASYGVSFEIEGRIPDHPRERLNEAARWVSSGYFAALDIPLLRGRVPSPEDDEAAPPVAVVSRGFAERYWPGESALGKRLRRRTAAEDPSSWITVVGVVADAKNMFVHEERQPLLYLPMERDPRRSPFLVVRSRADPEAALPAVEQVLQALDPHLPLSEVRSMQEVVAASTLPWRGATAGLVLLAALALLLSLLGLYGVVALAVGSRLTEIGVRRALGAQRGDVVLLIARQGIGLVLAGLAAGFVLSLGLSRLVEGLLFGVDALDPLTYVGVLLLVATAALLAMVAPALRAARIDPIQALRYE